MDIQGIVEPGFEPVRDALSAQFDAGQNAGAAVSVYQRGRKVVDIWAGVANEETGDPWRADTMAVCYSTTKGLAAACVHLLADRGLLSYDDPVGRYWPEFAQNGKERVTIFHVLTHQAGVPQVPAELSAEDLLDWDRTCAAIAREAPIWEPGTASGYHAVTFGYLTGEIVRRIDGRSIGRFLREEICGPLGVEDMHIGAPAEAEPRIAKLISRMELSPEIRAQWESATGSLAAQALGTRDGRLGDVIDTPTGHRAEIPAANGIMSASALARFYACLANYGELDGARILSEATVRKMSAQQTLRPDRVIILPIGWSMGYMTGGIEGWPQGPRVSAFGHAGLGGSVGFADPEIGMSFGFVPNVLAMDLIGYGRTAALAAAARACAEAVAA